MEKAKKTIEELVEKSQKALENPKLVEIAKTAPRNKDGRLNLSHAYNQAFGYAYGETKDLKKAKELAVSTRWLAMLRRDFEEEFEKLVSRKDSEVGAEEEKNKKCFEDIVFPLPDCVELISTELIKPDKDVFRERFIRFDSRFAYSHRDEARRFCMGILINLMKTFSSDDEKIEFHKSLQNDLIKILEERFGLEPFIEVLEKRGMKVKICGNCRHYREAGCPSSPGTCTMKKYDVLPMYGCAHSDAMNNYWAPKEKEVEEKEKVCRTCACRKHDTGGDPNKNESYMCGMYGLKQCVVSGQCEQWKESK